MITCQIYTTSNCFKCQDAKRLLEKEGIEYQEFDAIKYKDELEGELQLPIIKFDGKIIDIEELINLNFILKNKIMSPK